MKIFLFFILIFSLSGCGKNPIFSLLPEAVTDSGGQTTVLPFEENFDNYLIFVNGNNGWSVLTSGNVNLSLSSVYYKAGVKSLKISYPQGTGSLFLKKKFTTTSSKVFVEEYVRFETGTGINPTFLGLYINYELVISVKRGGGFIVSYYNKLTEQNKEQISTTLFDTQQWYKVKLKLDMSSSLWTWKLEIYDDTQTLKETLEGTLNVDKTLSGVVNYFGFESKYLNKSDPDTFYIDEIKVTEQ